MKPASAWVLLASVLAAAGAPAAAAAADEAALPWARPPGCTPSTCAGCTPYRVSTDNFTDSSGQGVVPADVCGSDGAYFPVPVEYFANCAKWFPYSWRCLPCCSAGCGKAACKWGGDGEYNATHGCSACPAATAPRLLELPAETCRSCFRSRKCFADQPTEYRVCEAKAPGQSVTQPPAAAASSPPAASAPTPARAKSPPPAEAPQPPEPAQPPPAAAANAPAPEVPAAAPEPQQAAGPPEAPPAPAPAPSSSSSAGTAQASGTAPAAPPPPSPPSAGATSQAAPLLALLLCVTAGLLLSP